ncbi:transporter [Escherichia coli]|uniref:Transporter n=1 Tax=Escherichia coli TaxID=562 RepID=A0A2X3JZL1_ECOLX|nr:transporter [Escherichia coli]
MFNFLRTEYLGRIWRPGEAMARWQAAQVSAIITLTPLFTLFFSDLLSLAWPDFFARPMLNLLGYLGAFVVVCGRDVFRHWSSYLGRIT